MNTSGILTAESCDFGQKVTDGDTTTYVNGNTASRGGAIYNGGANLQIVNCNFYGNKATVASGEGGGAICQNDNGHMSITGTGEFAGNEAKNQGGAIWTNDGKCVITGYDFVSNKSGGAGGALRVREKTGDYDIIMTDCDFTNNVSGAAAGAIYVSGGAEGYCTTLILAGTGTFSGNTCATNQYGSDIGLGGAKTATNLAVKYADESANYTFGGTVQYNDKTTCTISVLESVTE